MDDGGKYTYLYVRIYEIVLVFFSALSVSFSYRFLFFSVILSFFCRLILTEEKKYYSIEIQYLKAR